MFESYDQLNKASWIARQWQRAFNRQVTQLGINAAPIPTVTSTPTAPKPDISKLPQQYWVENPPQARVADTSDNGSQIASPELHRLMQQCQSADIYQRMQFYDQLDIIYTNEPITATMIERLVHGACSLNWEQEVQCAKGFKDNSKAQEHASRANRLYQPLTKLIPQSKKRMRIRNHLRYGVAYIQVIENAYGAIVKTRALPVKTIRINANEQLEFTTNQSDAYQQYDPYNLSKPNHTFFESEIVEVSHKMSEDELYGTPYILPAMGYAQGLIRVMKAIDDAREAGVPLTIGQVEDALGNSVPEPSLREMKWNSRAERIRRGEKPNASDYEWINGKGSVTRLESNGDYWSTDVDLRWRGGGIAGLFNRSLARMLAPETINRATLDRLTENDFEAEYELAMIMAQTMDWQILLRQISMANFAMSIAYPDSYSLKPGELFIDPQYIELHTEIEGRTTIDRQIERAELALRAWLGDNTGVGAGRKGTRLLSTKDANRILAIALEIDPEEALKNLHREQGIDEEYTDTQLKAMLPKGNERIM